MSLRLQPPAPLPPIIYASPWLPRPLLTSITYSQPPLCLDSNVALHLGLTLPPPQPALQSMFLFSLKSLPSLPWCPAPGEPQPVGPAPGTLEGVRVCSI